MILMMRPLATLWFLLVLFSLSALAQPGGPHKNLDLYGHLQPQTTEQTGGLHSSCWGYAAPDGREFAFLAMNNGTSIIDITELPIREVAFIPGPSSPWREIKVYKHYAYISSESRETEKGGGLQIVDLSRLPDTAVLARTDTATFISAHTIGLDRSFLYAYGTRAEAEVNGGAVIVALEPDPLNPARVGGIDTFYFHDGYVRNDTVLGAGVYGNGAVIYDVSDKANPTLIGGFNYPYSGTHNIEITADGRFAVTSDEIGFTKKTMKVWDISDPEDIHMVSEYSPNLVETIHNVRIDGRYVYAAWYTAGVRIIDLIDPSHPREVAFYDTYLGRDGGFNGVWDVYPVLPSGKIIASDRNSGLYVFTFDTAVGGSVSGIVSRGTSTEPVSNVAIAVSGHAEPVISDAAGAYYVGGVSGDTLTLSIREFGYAPFDTTLIVDGDVALNLSLTPLERTEIVLHARERETGRPVVDFQWTLDPFLPPAESEGDSAIFFLPTDSTYTITVGKWGYEIARMPVAALGDRTVVTIDLEPGYQDDATFDLGWSYEAPGDAAVTGRWNRIRPYLGYPTSDWVHPPSEPAGKRGKIFFTGQPPLFADPQSNDVSGGATTLTSPIMDLSMWGDPLIVFDLWYVQFERDTLRDSLVVELSNNGGETWHQVLVEKRGQAGWDQRVIFPANHLPLTPQMQLRLRLSDVMGNTLVVGGMDNFEVVRRVFTGVPSSNLHDQRKTELDLSVSP